MTDSASHDAHATVPPDGSVFVRLALFGYALLILYASLYPFVGWQSHGLPPLAYVSAPLPHYWTVFDVVTNVAAYMPFGMLLVLAIYPRIRGALALLVVLGAAVLWSGSMEAAQTFLPTRVPSNLDLLTNVGGAVVGGLIGLLSSGFLLGQSRLQLLRRRWFLPEASRGLIVICAWPLAQIYPQGYLFGQGQLMPILSDWVSDLVGNPVDLGGLLRPDLLLSAEQFWLFETIITAFGMTGAVLTLLCLLRKKAPRWMLALLTIVLALAVKSMATALLFAPENAFVWLTPGARGGVLLSLLMLAALAFASQKIQRRSAVLMLLIGLLAVNFIPPNPYFLATLQGWVQGKFLSFNGAAQFLSLVWPFFALWFLMHPVHRVRAAG
ncbi:VanZ family protein [Actimicrobium antarcticum]|uniref:VanZ family protein n=1 Tax=Actimicrobium antarcticum TaxID=1051899 RepID=A0ABP7T487_9BURK